MANKMLTYVAGHTGLVRSALFRRLSKDVGAELITAKAATLNLRRQSDTEKFLETHKIDRVYLAAAKVGGILATALIRPTSSTTTWL